MATMRLEINGSPSSSKRTKHIKARYFFIKDKVDTEEIEIEHCPTEIMCADVLNKPKGGRNFRLDHSYIMNVPVDYDNNMDLLKTLPDLLPEEDLILANSQRMHAPVHHMSVLDDNAMAYSQSDESRLVNSRLARLALRSAGTQISWWDIVANRQ